MLVRAHGQHIASSLEQLPALLDAIGAARVLLVLDRRAAEASGCQARLLDLLQPVLAGVFDDFTPNPRSEQPLAAARRACELRATAMVGLGGGSSMDVAKVAGLAAGAPDRAEELVRGVSDPTVTPLPIVAIPTTSGTGSDATHFAAVYHHGHKVSVAHPGMRPLGVVLDARLHVAMPPAIAAATGLDAFCQATESMWAVGATPESLVDAREAQNMICGHLAPSVLYGRLEDREAMMQGAHRAGHAINISKTTASHALSYALTTQFGIAHGLAVALTLGHVAAFNAATTDSDCNHPQGVGLVRARVHAACEGVGVSPPELAARMREILELLSLPATLSAAGVSRGSLDSLAHAADVVRLSNNPRRMSVADARALLEQAF
jgi:alcohol dehydrogenase class IV